MAMAISCLYPSGDDLLYEEEIIRNPFSLKLWWRYLIASPIKKRRVLFERAVKSLPGSYKLWHAYLRHRLADVRNLPVTDPLYTDLNNTFERALVTMHKMPRIWNMYLHTLKEQKLVTRTRRAFDRALRALPVTQHDQIWGPYLAFVGQRGVPVETSLSVYTRFLKYDPTRVEDLIEFLANAGLWQEAAERLASTLNDDQFCSIKGKTKHGLWLELCDLLTTHATEVSGLNVDGIIRGGISKFTDEVGPLWTSLADYYIRRNLHDKARDVFEEAMATVVTVRDFSVVFDAYSRYEESMLAINMDFGEEKEEEEEDCFHDDDLRLNVGSEFDKKLLSGFWLVDDNDVDMRLARLERLMDTRPELANTVLLRQNPHNVEQWHRRVKLFEGNPTKQILTYAQALRTVDPMKAAGKPHTLWVAFSRLYENHKDASNARVIFDKAVQVNYKAVDHLASVWCAWAEMELRLNNSKGALELMRRATAEPSVEVKQRAAADGNQPVQMKAHRSLRLWAFYVDLEESFGTLESTRAVYESILDLRIATPQIIINYAFLLQEHKHFEDAFRVYERGVKIFKYPHAKDIWATYLCKFVERYGETKLERARELFEHAVETTPCDQVKPLYLQYAKVEEDYGLAKRAMRVYDRATKAVPDSEKLSVYEIYIARAAELFGVPRTREIYQQAIESGLPDKDVKSMCFKYAELEKSLGEIDRARAIYVFASQFADQQSDADVWTKWREFEVQHGNEDTFREMLRIKRSVSASYSQVKTSGSANDTGKDGSNINVGFVSAGVESHDVKANHEDVELPEEIDSDDENIEIAQKDVPDAVFGGSRKRDEPENDGESRLGALERIKRLKKNSLNFEM